MFFSNAILGDAMPDRTLCLTFDDGPGLHTLEIAEYLHGFGIPGTFFLIGNYAERVAPGELRRLMQLGHLIGNHTRSHEDWVSHPVEEIERAHRAIEPFATTGRLGRLPFRAPRGFWNRSLAESLNADERLRRTYFGPVGWDIDCRDWEFWRKAKD